jgi:hypothetical protein
VAKVTDSLSAAAQRIMAAGFAANRPAAFIVQAVADATGEKVAARTVSRRAQEWRARRDTMERAKEQFAAMKAAGLDGAEMIQALAFETLCRDPEALTGESPIEFQSLGLKAQELRIKARQVDVRARELELDERRVRLIEEREKRAIAAVSEDKPGMSAEEKVREIRAIYGLRELPDGEARA